MVMGFDLLTEPSVNQLIKSSFIETTFNTNAEGFTRALKFHKQNK